MLSALLLESLNGQCHMVLLEARLCAFYLRKSMCRRSGCNCCILTAVRPLNICQINFGLGEVPHISPWGTFYWHSLYQVINSKNCIWGARACILGVWTCMLGLWTCNFGVLTCRCLDLYFGCLDLYFDVWTHILDVWNDILTWHCPFK